MQMGEAPYDLRRELEIRSKRAAGNRNLFTIFTYWARFNEVDQIYFDENIFIME